jgi:hypothetical protein
MRDIAIVAHVNHLVVGENARAEDLDVNPAKEKS